MLKEDEGDVGQAAANAARRDRLIELRVRHIAGVAIVRRRERCGLHHVIGGDGVEAPPTAGLVVDIQVRHVADGLGAEVIQPTRIEELRDTEGIVVKQVRQIRRDVHVG